LSSFATPERLSLSRVPDFPRYAVAREDESETGPSRAFTKRLRSMFGHELLATAIPNRLLHHSETLMMAFPSRQEMSASPQPANESTSSSCSTRPIARELLATGFGRAPERLGDGRPVQALDTEHRHLPLLVGEPGIEGPSSHTLIGRDQARPLVARP
jgi:hypothetical protein